MELELTEEQSWISESVDTLLSREWIAPGEVASAPAEQRRRAWAALVEFGALGIGDGDEGGLGAVELGLIARSLGHHLAWVPFLGSAAVRLALAPEARSLPPELAGLLSGQDAIGIALLERGSGWTVERAGTTLFHGRDGLEIRGGEGGDRAAGGGRPARGVGHARRRACARGYPGRRGRAHPAGTAMFR